MVEGPEHTSTRVLYISDSIGLGHAARDLAIARELRTLNPEVEIVWLAGESARQLIAEAGETLLPETQAFAHETGVAENTSGEFSLNVLSYALQAQSAWKQAVAAFEEVTARYEPHCSLSATPRAGDSPRPSLLALFTDLLPSETVRKVFEV